MSDEPRDEALEALLSEGLAHDTKAEERIMNSVSAELREKTIKPEGGTFAHGFSFRLALAAAVIVAATLGIFALFLDRGRAPNGGQSSLKNEKTNEASEDRGQPVALPELSEPKPGEEAWDGYLYETDKGICVGWNLPFICQTEGSWSKFIPSEYAAGLRAFASPVKQDSFTWVYDGLPAAGAPAAAFAKLPRYLVRLHGKVVNDTPDQVLSGSGVMQHPKIVAVEYLSEDWTRAWAALVATGYYPKIESLQHPPPERTEAQNAQLAPKVLDALLAMHQAAEISSEWRAALRKLAPDARPSNEFQREMEWEVQRWLVNTNKRLKLNLQGVDALGPLPPDAELVREWFLAAESKGAFLKKVREEWKGPLNALGLSYLPTSKGGDAIQYYANLESVQRYWTEDEYKRYRQATQEVFGEEKENKNKNTWHEFALSTPEHLDDWKRLKADLEAAGVRCMEGAAHLGTFSLLVDARDLDKALKTARPCIEKNALTVRARLGADDEAYDVFEAGKLARDEFYAAEYTIPARRMTFQVELIEKEARSGIHALAPWDEGVAVPLQTVFTQAADGKLGGPVAGAAVVLVGKLPEEVDGWGSFFLFESGTVAKGVIDLKAKFVEFVGSTAGQTAPKNAYFRVNLPSLPVGKYAVKISFANYSFDVDRTKIKGPIQGAPKVKPLEFKFEVPAAAKEK